MICGEGALKLEEVKLEGKKTQGIKDFVNGHSEIINHSLRG